MLVGAIKLTIVGIHVEVDYPCATRSWTLRVGVPVEVGGGKGYGLADAARIAAAGCRWGVFKCKAGLDH
jgi:hypothetical protein